jgi:DNA-binding MarR family transcriptional regulator
VSRESKQRLIEEVGEALRLHGRAGDEVDEAAARRLGLGRTDLRCLDVLESAGGMTAGELAKAAGLTTGAVTALLDRMETRGYVKRVRHRADRRKVIVEPTAKAMKAAGEIYGPIASEGWQLLEKMSRTELALIRDFMLNGRDLLIEHAQRIRREDKERSST